LPDVLPDSRLQDPKATVMVDWPMGDGTTIRLELEPIYCFNCGKPNGYVPRHVMSFVSWMCQPCSIEWGKLASAHTHADQAFWDKVESEMLARFGKALTQEELAQLADQNRLGRPLELLEKESPYVLWRDK
jgi:hypothetical protein